MRRLADRLGDRFVLLLPAGLSVLGLVAVLVISVRTVGRARVDGPAGARVLADKDLVADLLPPPLDLLELQNRARVAVAGPGGADALADAYALHRSRYEERMAYWDRTLVAGDVRDEVTGAFAAASRQYFAVCERELLPALRAGDLAAARAAADGPLRRAFEDRRAAADRVVARANARAAADLAAAAAAVRWNIRAAAALAVLTGGLAVGLAVLAVGWVTDRQGEKSEALEEQARLALLQAEVGEALNRDAPLPDLLRDCAEVVLRRTAAAFVRVWTLREAERVLELQASAGLYTHTDGPHARVPVGHRKIGRIAATGVPHLTNAVADDPAVDREWAVRESLVGFAGHPLVCNDRVVGVLALFACYRLSDDALRALGVVADAVAQGVARKQAEGARRAAEARHQAVVAGALDCIITVDRHGRVVEFNPAAERTFGYARGEAVGQELDELIIPPEHRAAHRDGIARYLATGETRVLNRRLTGLPARRRDGTTFPAELTVVPIELAGEPVFTAFLRDITREHEAAAALRASEERFRLAARVGGLAVAEVDYAADLIHLSPEAAALFGLPGDRPATRAAVHALVHPADRPALAGHIAASLDPAGPGEFALEHRVVRPDGEVVWVNARKQISFAGGRPARALLAVFDVTARKRAEETLRVLFEYSSDAHLLFDAGGIFEANSAAAAMLGFADKGELLGRHPAEFSPRRQPDGRPSADKAAEMDARARAGGCHRFDWQHRRADGAEFPCEVTLTPVEVGGRSALLAVWHDLTVRKRAEEELRAAQAAARKLALVAEHTHNPVVITDAGGLIEWVNDGFERLTGYTLAEVAGRKAGALLQGPETDPATVAHIRERVRAGQGFEVEILNYSKAGRSYWLAIECRPVRDEAGRVTNYVAVESDVTARREAARALEEAKAAAEAASRAKSEFLANMSHEFRTPMGAIIGYAEMLLDPRLGVDERVQTLHAVIRNGRHMVALINDVLDLAKIEAGRMDLEAAPSSLPRLVAEALSAAGVRAQEKGLDLRVSPAGPVPRTVTTDPTRLRQVLDNLLSNAVKFTGPGGRVEVRVGLADPAAGPRLVVEVEDDGVGMTADQLGRLFRPFTQADASTTRKYGGTGLGLSICKRLAEMLGGGIAVRSAPGEGTCFTLALPIAPGDLADLIPPAEFGSASHLITPETGPPARPMAGRVLLVDDNPDNRRIIKYFLDRAGLAVDTAENGRVAVEKAMAAEYDLILMDMQMPELDGYGATSALRQKGYARGVVALTANAMAGDEEKCLRAGCNAYLTKPVEAGRLLKVVARHIPSRSWAVKVPAARPAPPAPAAGDPAASGGASGLAALAAGYRRSLPGKVRDVAAAVRAADLAAAAKLAHKLKGSAGMYGLPAVSEAAGRVEEACRAGDADAAARLADRLVADCEAVGR